MALDVIVAVKNGPLEMWRALGSPTPAVPIGRLTTSLPWIAAMTFGYVLLAVVVSRQVRRRPAALGEPLAAATVALGVLVTAELLLRSAALGLIVPFLLGAAWVALLLTSGVHPRRGRARR
jgi:hypothetical protein